MLKAEDMFREIESAGHQVIGGRELIGYGRPGPRRVTARNIENGR